MGTFSKAIRSPAVCASALFLVACSGSVGPDESGQNGFVRSNAPPFNPTPPPTPLPSPRISIPPAGATVGKGAGVVFGVLATGNGGVSYQWLKGNVALPGQTGSTLTIAAASTSDAGQYSVRV